MILCGWKTIDGDTPRSLVLESVYYAQPTHFNLSRQGKFAADALTRVISDYYKAIDQEIQQLVSQGNMQSDSFKRTGSRSPLSARFLFTSKPENSRSADFELMILFSSLWQQLWRHGYMYLPLRSYTQPVWGTCNRHSIKLPLRLSGPANHSLRFKASRSPLG